jgi:hypothetical protein
MSDSAAEVLTPFALRTFLMGVAPETPDTATAGRIKRRVLARVAMLASDDRKWGPLGDGIAYRVLHDDGRTFGWLMNMTAGTRLPVHSHDDGDEECLVISGSVIAQGERLCTGDYQVALRHSVHDDVWCDEDALIYLRSASSQRPYLLKQRSAARAQRSAA